MPSELQKQDVRRAARTLLCDGNFKDRQRIFSWYPQFGKKAVLPQLDSDLVVVLGLTHVPG